MGSTDCCQLTFLLVTYLAVHRGFFDIMWKAHKGTTSLTSSSCYYHIFKAALNSSKKSRCSLQSLKQHGFDRRNDLTLIKHVKQIQEEKEGWGNSSSFISEVQRKTQLLREEGRRTTQWYAWVRMFGLPLHWLCLKFYYTGLITTTETIVSTRFTATAASCWHFTQIL